MEKYDSEIIKGVTVDYFYDTDSGAPWKEYDGNGVIRNSSTREKKPGEVLIKSERGNYWLYDVQETTHIAKRDKWGIAPELAAGLTRGQIVALAVKNDREYCAGYLNDEWHWVGICVGGDSLWGVETYKDHHREVAREMVDEYLAREAKEKAEREYWNERDMVTS